MPNKNQINVNIPPGYIVTYVEIVNHQSVVIKLKKRPKIKGAMYGSFSEDLTKSKLKK